jgi:hypothetical protein
MSIVIITIAYTGNRFIYEVYCELDDLVGRPFSQLIAVNIVKHREYIYKSNKSF